MRKQICANKNEQSRRPRPKNQNRSRTAKSKEANPQTKSRRKREQRYLSSAKLGRCTATRWRDARPWRWTATDRRGRGGGPEAKREGMRTERNANQ
ncbi:hypothetical protein NL676_017194 [Syzygium grande]|nr:hypothetical protein NL676_017194 [Syzygium grande]